MAALNITAGVSVGTEYNTNAFDLNHFETPPNGDTDRGDFSKRLSANFGVEFVGAKDGPVKMELRGSLINADFGRFDTISRRDHDLTGRLEWKPNKLFDVALEAAHEREPVELADVGGTDATQQTGRRVQGTLGLGFIPNWRLALTPLWREVSTPLLDAPNYTFTERSGTAALQFLGIGRLMPGVSFTQSHGRYTRVETPSRYDQHSIQGTLNYAATAASTFSLSIGRDSRTTRVMGRPGDVEVLIREFQTNALTGSLGLHRQLTAKTGFNITAYRRFDLYDAGVNTTVNTGLTSGINWAATPKLSATVDAGLEFSNIELPQFGSTSSERKDLVRTFSMALTYQVARRVTLRSYVIRRVRNSEAWSAQFNNSIAGLELTANFATIK